MQIKEECETCSEHACGKAIKYINNAIIIIKQWKALSEGRRA